MVKTVDHMQHLYSVSPVWCQPEYVNDNEPQPISYPWGKGFLAAAVLAFLFLVALDVLYAAWLLGAGS